jgi:hypothetical protein
MTDDAPLLGSYAIAAAVGLTFLLLVRFGPHAPTIAEPLRRPPGELRDLLPSGIAPSDPTPLARRPNRTGDGRGEARNPAEESGDISRAFDAPSGSAADPANILRAVAVNRAAGQSGDQSGKVIISGDAGASGTSAPGRGGIGGTGAGGGAAIGGVANGAVVVRAYEPAVVPPAVPVDPLGAPARDVGDLGMYVRGRESQLSFCYREEGLKVNSSLAGSIAVTVDIAGRGHVRSARVSRRTWSGAGALAAESCILRTIGGWQFPATDGGSAVYTFPFSFTR